MKYSILIIKYSIQWLEEDFLRNKGIKLEKHLFKLAEYIIKNP